MARSIPIFVALALAAAASPAGAQPREHGPTGLRYDLLPPKGWDGTTRVELFVCLHGVGDDIANFRTALESRLAPLEHHWRLYVQSPATQWTTDDDGKVLQLLRDLRREMRFGPSVAAGFMAGALLATRLAFDHPGEFDGAVLLGATYHSAPASARECRRGFYYWRFATEDPLVVRRGGAEALRDKLDAAGYAPDHVRIEAVAGAEALAPDALAAGLRWLLDGLRGGAPMTAEDRALVDSVPAHIAAGDVEAIRRVVRRVGESRRREALAYLFIRVKGLPNHADRALSLAGIELVGQLGDPRAAAVLSALLPKLREDRERSLAAIAALDALDADAAVEPLARLLACWEHDGAAQVAAADALGRLGRRSAVPALVRALASSARRPGRDGYVAALERALRALTGQTVQGPAAWQAWLRARR